MYIESVCAPFSVDMGIQGARILVKATPLVMLARSCSKSAANKWLQKLPHDAQTKLVLFTCKWEGSGGGVTMCCAVSNVAKVLDRAAEEKSAHAAGQGLGGVDYQSASQEDRCAAVAAVQQAAKDEVQKILAARQVAISEDRKALVESLGGMCTEEDVDAVHFARTECASRLVAAVEATGRQKEALEGRDKELNAEGRRRLEAEARLNLLADRVSALQKDVKEAREALENVQQVHPSVKNYFRTSAREMLDLPCTTGEAVPVAFSLYMPVENDDGAAGFETVGGVLQEEATSEEAMVALEGLMRCPSCTSRVVSCWTTTPPAIPTIGC